MMAELEIDQSNLPRVQEVCQCFAVLEDGALAHNLQEQEIEQYYTTNIQKNQLVQNDIRVAKRLQDEEEEEQAQQSTLLRQASRTLEEQDFEYARLIQEQLQRRAEEAQRREHDDEEIAKRMQEEEEHRLRRSSSREQAVHSEGSASDTALPPTNQHSLSSLQRAEELYPSTTTRGQYSPSQTHSDLTEPRADCPRGEAAQHQNTTSRSNQGHTDSYREIRSKWRDILNEESEDSDSVFSESSSQRHNERRNTAPHRRWTSLHRPQERSYRSLGSSSRRSFTDEQMNEERGERDEGYYENQDLERPRNSDQERYHRGEYEHRSRDQDVDSRSVEVRREGRPCGRSESVRLHDRRNPGNRHLARTWSYKDNNNSDRRVHFGEDGRSSNSSRPQQQQGSGGVWEMLGQVLRERGVAVKLGTGDGEAPLQILGPQSRDSQDVLHTGSQVSCGQDPQPHQRGFQRASTARHSFHGDIREKRRSSHRESSGRDHREDGDSQRYNNNVGCDGELYEITTTDSYYDNSAERGSGRRRGRDGDGERNANDFGVRSTSSDGRRWHRSIEERLSSEQEQEAERRVERPQRRAPPQRSQSLSCSNGHSTRDRSRHMAAGASVQTEPGRGSLDLGQLQQVLEDEELARTLQEEEHRPLRRKSESSAVTCYPDGDFRVAQVAQDEEIARFMQKEEVKSKRRSRELEGPGSWREHRAMISHHDRRTARDRWVQRERLDSEGLPSPTEDCSTENQPPSPISTTPQAQQIRNIAEELDPTFQARRQGTESVRVAQTGPACQSLPTPQSGLPEFLEEPTFIPPTKRPTEKSAPARSKPKEKKENCKQQ